jgi:hypothetical protein
MQMPDSPVARRRAPCWSDPAPLLETIPLNVDLPPDPKTWTLAQAGAYQLTALRVRGSTAALLATTVAYEVAAFVVQGRVFRRAFVRFVEAALDQWGLQPQPETSRGSSGTSTLP